MTQVQPDPAPETDPPRSPPGRPTEAAEADATDPSLALADVWRLLDVLPAAAASPDMLATTLEMAAVTGASRAAAAGAGGPRAGVGRATAPDGAARAGWPAAAAAVLASLVIGLAAGRATAPNPELAILANLPIAEHVDMLREAGSVAFLEEVARRGYSAPRRPPAQSAAVVRADEQEFEAAIESLRAADIDGSGRELLASRREQVLQLPDDKRRELEKAVEAYQRLSAADRRELVALGRALADPGREQLLKAARIWHLWIQRRDPADRRDVIDLGTADRLEWLDRWTRLDSRNDPRLDGRDNGRQFFEREFENRRRPAAESRPGDPEFRDPPPEFRRDDQPRPPGPPRPRGPGGGPRLGPGFGPGGALGRWPEPRPADGMREPGRPPGPLSDREPPPPPETPAAPR